MPEAGRLHHQHPSGHGHVIAKGLSLDRMMAELYGKTTGYCKGKGGSMHITDFSRGILGANGIVGGGIPIATGAALSAKMRKSEQVVVCFFGDGASNQGAFYEAANMAAVWTLPIVFVCENNLYALSTPHSRHQKTQEIAVRAAAFGFPGSRWTVMIPSRFTRRWSVVWTGPAGATGRH